MLCLCLVYFWMNHQGLLRGFERLLIVDSLPVRMLRTRRDAPFAPFVAFLSGCDPLRANLFVAVHSPIGRLLLFEAFDGSF